MVLSLWPAMGRNGRRWWTGGSGSVSGHLLDQQSKLLPKSLAIELLLDRRYYGHECIPFVVETSVAHQIEPAPTVLGRQPGTGCLDVGDGDGAAVARELNDTGEEAFALAHLAGLDASRGDFERAEERAHGALRLNAQVEWRPWVPMLAIPALAWSRAVVGDWRRADDALAALGEPGRLLERVGGAVRGMGQIERALVRAASADATDLPGFDPTEVVERYASRIVLARADGSGLGVVAALIELADSQAMCSSVPGAVEVLSRARDAGALLCSGWPCLIPRVLGVAAMAQGAKGDQLLRGTKGVN